MSLSLTSVDIIILLAIYFVVHYLIFSRYNTKISSRYIRAFRNAFKKLGFSVGEIVKIKGLHRFSLNSSLFSKGLAFTLLLPREMPINWLLSKLLHRSDYVTLEANLFKPPVVQLEILRDSPRWRKLISSPRVGWNVSKVPSCPFYISVYRGEGLEFWLKKLREFLTKYGSRMEFVDRISIRYRPPHIIVNFAPNGDVNGEKILYSLRLVIKIINIITAYKLKKK